MEKYLKWESCDKHWEETLPQSGKVIQHHVTRELTCSHPLVEKAWFYGALARSADEPKCYLEIVTKDHQRFNKVVSSEQYEIPEAEEWLQLLNQNQTHELDSTC